MGGVLLVDALARVVVASRTVAARFVVVDAVDDRAAAFYDTTASDEFPGRATRPEGVGHRGSIASD